MLKLVVKFIKMRTLYLTSCFILCSLLVNSQTTYTWTGNQSTDFNDPLNWNPSSGAPSLVNDVAIFNAGSNNCLLTGAVNIGGWMITNGYTGTIDCDVYDVTVNGTFQMDGGTFINSSETTIGLTIGNGGSFIHTGGTFTDNGGIIILAMPTTQVYTLQSTGITITQLRFQSTSSGTRSITTSGITTATLNYNSTLPLSLSGAIDVTENLTISGSASNGTPSGHTGTINLTGTNPIVITGVSAANNARGKLPNIRVNTTSSITITNAIHVMGNWVHDAGTLVSAASSSVYFSGSGVSISGSAIDGTALNFNNVNILSGASVSLPTAADLVVARTFSNSGTVSNAASAGLVFTSSVSAVTGVSALERIAIASGGTLTLSSALAISELVDIRGSGRLNTGGFLTLVSNASEKGRIGEITSGTLNGNVQVNAFIPGPTTGWGLIGAPVNGMTVADLENSFFITCTGCTFDPTVVPGTFYSVQGWDGDDFTTTSITSGSPLTPGIGFWTYIGDDVSTTSNLTLIGNLSSVVTGGYNISVPAGTGGSPWTPGFFYALTANPYPSPIDADLFVFDNNANIQANLYIYDANNGAFTTVPFGGGVPLPIGQGFYVEATNSGNVSLDFFESQKIASTASHTKNSRPKVSKFSLAMKGSNGVADKTYFMFNSETTAGFDWYDTHKLKTSLASMMDGGGVVTKSHIASKWLGEEFGVLSLPIPTQSVTIPLITKVSATGVYSITVGDINDFRNCTILHDKYTNAYHDLSKGPYIVTISDTTSVPRFELLICQDENANSVGIEEFSPVKFVSIGSNANGAYVLTQFQNETSAKISAYNLIGQKIMEDMVIEGKVTEQYLPIHTADQLVIIKVEANGEVTTKKVMLQQ